MSTTFQSEERPAGKRTPRLAALFPTTTTAATARQTVTILLGLVLAGGTLAQDLPGDIPTLPDRAAASASSTNLRHLTVSAGIVAGNEEPSDSVVGYFVKRIGMARDYSAKRLGNCPWNELPQGAAPDDHLNIMRLKFGDRLELVALMFDANGTVTMAARAPALFQPEPFFTHTLPSGDYQWPANAPNDLVANFAYAMERRSKPKGPYQLSIELWQQKADQAGDVNLEAAGSALSTSDAGVVKIHPLAMAAMYAEGFSASTNTQDAAIVLRIKMDELECAIKASLYQGDKKICELQRHGIGYEKLYDGLRALFLNLIEWQGTVTDFFNPGLDNFCPLAVAELDSKDTASLERKKILLTGKDKGGLMSVEAATGTKPWTKPYSKGESALGRNGQVFLRGGSRLTRIAPATGEPEFTVTTWDSDQMDVRRNFLADALYHDLRLQDKGVTVWTNRLPWTICAGPLLTDDGVVVGDAKGEFRCFSLKGQELWKATLPRCVRGAVHANGGLFFATDDLGRLYVIDQQGKLAWQADIGDVMTGPPDAVGATLVIGSKSGKVFLCDKATGKILKERAFTSWLLGCRVVGTKIVCLTLDKRLHILDAGSLAEDKTLRFPFGFTPDVMLVSDFPQRRLPGELDLAEKTTGCLLTDVKGNVYLCSPISRP